MILCTTFCLALAAVGLAGIGVLLVRCMLWRRRQGRLEASRAGLGNARRAAVGGVVLLAAAGLTAGLGWRALRDREPRSVAAIATEPNRGPVPSPDTERAARSDGPDGTGRRFVGPPSPFPPKRYTGQRQREFEARWLTVRAEAGEQPCDSAIPTVGYVSGNRYYKARWRMPPDATVANNLKPE